MEQLNDRAKDKPVLREIYSEQDVLQRIDELADEIIGGYAGQDPLFVCLMRGGMLFSTLLMMAIARRGSHPELDTMTVSTYGSGRVAREPVIILDLDPRTKIEGRTVIVLDEVYETGLTARHTAEDLRRRGAASTDLCVLVRKGHDQPEFGGNILYGFDAEGWLVGGGMDGENEAFRWICSISVVVDSANNQESTNTNAA